MGRFATTVALYEELRPPYPPSFFREVAQRLLPVKLAHLVTRDGAAKLSSKGHRVL